jgi:hypothetical protein
MSERPAIAHTFILPFTVGMFIGGTATGWICLALGFARNLGELSSSLSWYSWFSWLIVVAFSVLIGSVLQRLLLELVSFQFLLSVRLTPAPLVIWGIVAGSVATIASCLVIDLRGMPFQKLPSIPFPYLTIAIQSIALFLLVKRVTPLSGEAGSKTNDYGQRDERKDRPPPANSEAQGNN